MKRTAIALAAAFLITAVFNTSFVLAAPNYNTNNQTDFNNTQINTPNETAPASGPSQTGPNNGNLNNNINNQTDQINDGNVNNGSNPRMPVAAAPPVIKDTSWFDYRAPKDTYKISTAAQLMGLASLVNEQQPMWKPNHTESFQGVTFVLTKDIKLTEPWIPIGIGKYNCFMGTFDGGDHTISGLNIKPGHVYSGLFGYLPGKVTNLKVEGKVQSKDSYTGSIAGRLVTNGEISNCHSYVKVSGRDKTGGIAGDNRVGTVKLCQNHETIKGTCKVGGITGENYGGKILKSCNSGEVISNTRNIGTYGTGGIAGKSIADGALVSQCYNKGTITSANEGTGGIVGYANATGSKITDCYNTGNMVVKDPEHGNLKATSNVGGIAGIVGSSSVVISNCYNTGSGLGANNSGGIIGYFFDNKGYGVSYNISNNYYATDDFKYGIGLSFDKAISSIEDSIIAVSEGTLNNYSSKLGSSYMKDHSGIYGNGGLPVLTWQKPLSEEDKEYLEGVSIDVQKRLDQYMTKHTDSLLIGQIVIDLFNTTNLLSDSIFNK